MGTVNLVRAKKNLNELSSLIEAEKMLKDACPYLPREYDEAVVKERISKINNEISLIEETEEKYRKLVQEGKSTSEISNIEELDEIINSYGEKLKEKENFEKYKELNDKKNTIYIDAVINISDARGDLFATLFEDSLVNNVSISSFVNSECLRNSRIKKPFMVALLTMDPDMIYEEIVSSYSLDQEQNDKIHQYILYQKNRVNRNLVLTDKTLINLIESSTSKNIVQQENINTKRAYYDYCNSFSGFVFNKPIEDVLLTNTPEFVYNAFNKFCDAFKLLSNVEKNRIKQQLEAIKNYILKSNGNYRDLKYHIGILGQDGKYIIEDKNKKRIFSLDRKGIKDFASASNFVRTVEDMRISNFPISDTEKYIHDCFNSSKVPDNVKQQLIAVVLENLELCYNMYNSYYNSQDMDITSTLNMLGGNSIELQYKLNEVNLPHILGISPSHKIDGNNNIVSFNLPPQTLSFIGLSTTNYTPAIDVLKAILDHKDDIVRNMGCFSDNGTLYEMLPWEKLILKTNAFIRGDFFKSTSFITSINPDSYLINPNDRINAVAINSTYFSGSPINQQVGEDIDFSVERLKNRLFIKRNSLLQKNKDLILKGLIAQYNDDKISRINGVVTNASFIGERLIGTNGIPIKTMNIPEYLLENINSSNGGIIESVENPLGSKLYSIDEMIVLLEDMLLTFDNENMYSLAYEVINQMEEYNKRHTK